MGWRAAGSLLVLFQQFNDRYPGRSRASDGTVGDAAHRSRTSDHNPWYGPGIVTAGDYTHDSRVGMDIGRLTNELVASRDRRIKYIIANGSIVSGAGGPSPWTWRRYTGPNPHRKHFHLSVVASPLCDDRALWRLPSLAGHHPPPPPPGPPPAGGTLRPGSKGARVTQLQLVLNRWYPKLPQLRVDGDYGPATTARVRYFQERAGIKVDGVAGPVTLGKLGIR